MLTDPELLPVTVGLDRGQRLSNAGSGGEQLWNLITTGALVSILPLIVVVPVPAAVLAGRADARQPQVPRTPTICADPDIRRPRQNDPCSPHVSPSTRTSRSGRSTADCSAPSSSTSAAASTTASTSPGHPTADEDGFRTDVLDLVRELGVSTIRYPGGNFVSGFRWEDGVGPRERAAAPARPRLALDRDERGRPATSSRRGSTRSAASSCSRSTSAPAARWRRSTCSSTPTSPAAPRCPTQRIANGATEPFGVRMWCLGNEMDGPWQLGHRSAEDYGKLASQTAKAMRQLDPSLELVVCGSSSAHMPTFGEWERVVLDAHLRRRRLHLVPRLLRGAATATSAASSPPRSTWTTSSRPSSRPPTT